MVKIPADIEAWLQSIRTREPIAVDYSDARELVAILGQPVFLEAVRRAVMDAEAKKASMLGMNPMDVTGQAEILRVQGELRGLVAVFETLWETANVS